VALQEESEREIIVPLPDELVKGGVAVVQAAGRDVVVLREGDEYRAIDRWCLHEKGDLGEGMMFGKHIKCPVHGYIFDLVKGQCLNHFAMVARVYEVEIHGNELTMRPITKPIG
jgi:nitrite reductase/ring-hydroxylating ferredoxin subunit